MVNNERAGMCSMLECFLFLAVHTFDGFDHVSAGWCFAAAAWYSRELHLQSCSCDQGVELCHGENRSSWYLFSLLRFRRLAMTRIRWMVFAAGSELGLQRCRAV